jgi:hypothetical protein
MTLRIPNKTLAMAIGVGSLALASWAFTQAWEARGEERPRVAKWLAI